MKSTGALGQRAAKNQTSAAPPNLAGRQDRLRAHRGVGERHADANTGAVREALDAEGRSLEPGVRERMERRLGNEFVSVPVRSAAASPSVPRSLSLGGRHSAQEVQAERAAQGSGESRGGAERRRVDLGGVTVHSGPRANSAVRAVNAQAFAVGSHVVMGQGQYAPHTTEGSRVLAHELAHTIQPGGSPGLVQRTGFFESIARFFGGGTFSDQELNDYMDGLEATGKIEDNNDSDNKARAAVDKGLYASRPAEVRALLVLEMLSGYTGGSDREKILVILEKASNADRERIVDRVTMEALLKKLTDDEDRNKLYGILKQVKQHRGDDVNTEWSVGYKAQGAEELQPERFGLVIDHLAAKPSSGGPQIAVANGATNSDPAGAPSVINSSIKHPHGTGGDGYLLYHVAQRSADGSVSPVSGGAPRMDNAPYEPVTLDKRSITANIEITFEEHKTGETGATKSQGSQQGTDVTKGSSSSVASDVTDATKNISEATKGVTKDVTKGQSHQVSSGKKTGVVTTTSGAVSFTASTKDTKLTETSYGGEFSANGSILALLLAASGPEALPLLGILSELKLLDSTTFKVTAQSKDTVGYEVMLSGQVQAAWSKAVSEEKQEGEVDTTSKDVKKGEQKVDKKGAEVSHSVGKKNVVTQDNSVKKSSSTNQQTGESKTQILEVPIIKGSKLTFGVKESKGQPKETTEEKPAAKPADGAAGATGAKTEDAGAAKETK